MIIRFFGPVMYMGLLAFVQPTEWRAIQSALWSWRPRPSYRASHREIGPIASTTSPTE